MNELALFAGAGGGILGGQLLGWKTVCAVENEPYAISVLLQRQNDKVFPPFPIWDDICTFDGKPWRGIIEVVSGGFPCQDISSAGEGTGIKGKRSGLWSEMARVIGEVKPEWVFAENSPMLVSRGLNIVLTDLTKMGFNARWGIVGADDVGAPHKRKRIWIVGRNISNSNGIRQQRQREHIRPLHSKENKVRKTNFINNGGKKRKRWWQFEPQVDRVVNGVSYRSHQLKAIGNGQVPEVVRTAWKILSKGL
jgi:DNA (cytosine-5)-methyltransferase 1